jgi:hypothetical protein
METEKTTMEQFIITQSISIILLIVKNPKHRRQFATALKKVRDALVMAFPIEDDFKETS